MAFTKSAKAAMRRAWDESKHPRVPKGHPTGGEFTVAGKRVEPTRWYHVGPPRRGLYTFPTRPRDSLGEPPSQNKTGRVFSTTAFTYARRAYGDKVWAGNDKSVLHRVVGSSAVLRNARSYRHGWRTANSPRQMNLNPLAGIGIDREQRGRLRTIQAPRARGRASRGRY